MTAAPEPLTPDAEQAARRRHRAIALKMTQLRKLDKMFTGRTWDIVREVHLPEGKVFQTPFGNKARHGWVLKERDTGEQIVVGWSVLKQISERYLGVTRPSTFRRRNLKPEDYH